MTALGSSLRRCLGAVCLFLAMGMLVGGQTVLKPRLAGRTYLVYWLMCLLFTALAMFIALLEARAIQRQSEAEQKNLMQHTLSELEHDLQDPPADSPR
jgi:membrane protein implicated in regulation of membrane protease activity